MTLPAAERQAPVARGPAVPPATRFVGAGLRSGVASAVPGPRSPELYDFSFFEEMERHLLPAQRERRLDALTFVVFDAETTGLSPRGDDRIVSLAGVRERRGTVRRAETFDALVKPGRAVPAESVRFHGITDAMLEEAPPIDVVLPAFQRFADGAVLVGHEVWFDLAFLAREVRRLGIPPLPTRHAILDTRLLSEVVHGARADHTLEAVAARLGVEIQGRHSALGDALATAEVFVRLLELLRKRGIRTLGQALDVARAVPGAGRVEAGP
jgi:DNA polymerase-3 subunit epsilon